MHCDLLYLVFSVVTVKLYENMTYLPYHHKSIFDTLLIEREARFLRGGRANASCANHSREGRNRVSM